MCLKEEVGSKPLWNAPTSVGEGGVPQPKPGSQPQRFSHSAFFTLLAGRFGI